MLLYAGIDEAGYGPKFGPMTIGMSVIALKNAPSADKFLQAPLNLWQILENSLCKDLKTAKSTGKLPVNDSKKLKTPSSGITHIERSILSFIKNTDAFTAFDTLDQLMTSCGSTSYQKAPLWYCPTDQSPWPNLPSCQTPGQLSIDASMLQKDLKSNQIKPLDFRAAILFENQFNQMVAKTHSKASASFTFVSKHINYVWQRYGHLHPYIAIDRQGGRTQYRHILASCFPQTQVDILEETKQRSAYKILTYDQSKTMVISFEVGSEQIHLPTALASMLSKYFREMLMYRFQAYFQNIAPDIKPCAGYGSDAKRFWEEIQPNLALLGIKPHEIRRMS